VIARLALLAVTSLGLSGCYFTRSPLRPMPALYAQAGAQRSRCLVVMMQGILDGPEAFLEHEAVRDLQRSSPCDAVMVDTNFRYYFGARIADALYEDVLHPAIARGYEEIWLVGVSLGGLGAVLLAREHPQAITGIVLLSPFLGVDPVLSEVTSHGLAAWRPPRLPRRVEDPQFTAAVWSWLRGYVTDPDAMPAMYVGWAEGELREPMSRTLADVLPVEHVAHVEGRHDWAAWSQLWRTLLREAEPGR
jgi:pimeloyl-ACP methyl ester carboxylesterase